jgi:phosphoserine phosphatase RsbU/P
MAKTRVPSTRCNLSGLCRILFCNPPHAPSGDTGCYTDGITEAMNGQHELFGEDRLADICARSRRIPVNVMVEEGFAQLDEFLQGEPQRDDQALLAMEITD